MRMKCKRSLSLLLTLAMVMSLFCGNAWAAETNSKTDQESTQVEEVSPKLADAAADTEELPDYDIWLAKAMLFGYNNTGNGLYPMFRNFQDPVYRQLGVEVPVDIASIPLFVRSGAIIPMSGNALHNLMTEKTTALDILMAPDVDSAFTLYEDDGRTNDYRKGAYLKTKIDVKAGVKTVVTFTNEGSYETAVESMALDMIHREKSPFYVQLDGQELPHFLHRRKFEEAESGWYYSQRLKSVQIKYPNPKKDHEVLVSFEQFDLIGM